LPKKIDINPAIDKGVTELIAMAKTFDEKKAALELAMKADALKLKARGPEWGKGFEQEGGDDDSSF
jgi:hypothetical protein